MAHWSQIIIKLTYSCQSQLQMKEGHCICDTTYLHEGSRGPAESVVKTGWHNGLTAIWIGSGHDPSSLATS